MATDRQKEAARRNIAKARDAQSARAHGKDVPRIELVSLRQQMALRHRLYQVGSNADSISRADYSAFEQRIHLELPRNLRQRFRCLSVADR